MPGARLLIVGRGPYEADLREQAARAGVADDVVFTGGVPEDELAAHIVAGDVFAMPCRTRRRGLDVEGLGMVYLEAGACAIPVVAGDSGGAPDAVLDGETGYVVDGRDVADVADRITTLLRDPALRLRMGTAGRTLGRAGLAVVAGVRTPRPPAPVLSEMPDTVGYAPLQGRLAQDSQTVSAGCCTARRSARRSRA